MHFGSANSEHSPKSLNKLSAQDDDLPIFSFPPVKSYKVEDIEERMKEIFEDSQFSQEQFEAKFTESRPSSIETVHGRSYEFDYNYSAPVPAIPKLEIEEAPKVGIYVFKVMLEVYKVVNHLKTLK